MRSGDREQIGGWRKVPADDQADLEFSYCVEWANHRGGAESISLGEDGRVQIMMEQPNFQTLVAHSNLSVEELVKPTRPYSMFYENALILLDEPASGLDPVVTRSLYDVVERINKKTGITVIMVSHDIPAAMEYASKILHLGSDRQLYFGSMDNYRHSAAYHSFLGGSAVHIWKHDGKLRSPQKKEQAGE